MENMDSESNLSLSFESSSFGSIDESFLNPEIYDKDIQPYQFEPDTSYSDTDSNGEGAHAQDEYDADRLLNNDWCKCGHCNVMPKAEECICCQEISQVKDKMVEHNTDIACITEHPGFQPVCLNPYVLETAYFQYRQQYGNIQVNNEMKNRYTAYRQLARWCWGFLGRSVRVRLPACATLKIREEFQSDNYTGYKEAE